MNAALCASRAGCVLLLAVAPWLFTPGLIAEPQTRWACDSAFEVLRHAGQGEDTRLLGRLAQYYAVSGRGLSRLNGRLQVSAPGEPLRVHTFHRVSEFVHGQAGPFLKKRIDKVARGMGDTLPPEWTLEYFHEPGTDQYLQVMRLGGQRQAMGAIGMPRLFCNAF